MIVGGYDWVCPPVNGRALAAGIPDARLVEIPAAGHFPFSEEPENFRTVVREFIRDRDPAGREPDLRPTEPAGTPGRPAAG